MYNQKFPIEKKLSVIFVADVFLHPHFLVLFYICLIFNSIVLCNALNNNTINSLVQCINNIKHSVPMSIEDNHNRTVQITLPQMNCRLIIVMQVVLCITLRGNTG